LSPTNGHNQATIGSGKGSVQRPCSRPTTEIASWIHEHADVEFVSSAALRFDRMPLQAPADLAGVARPHDPSRTGDWSSLALVYAFVHALETHGRVLDIGSGDGWPALPLAPYLQQVVGIDASPRRTDVANENLRRFGYDHVQFRTARGEKLPFRDRHFDGVVSGTAIEQAESREAVLAEAFRVLRPGGRFVATFENVAAERWPSTGSTASADLVWESDALSVDEHGDLVYRYAVVSPQTLCETEYRVVFTGKSLSTSLPSLGIPFNRPSGPDAPLAALHEIDGEDPKVSGKRGIDVLDKLLALPSLRSIAAQVCTVRHFSVKTITQALFDAGFREISVHGRVSRAVAPVVEDLASRGVLSELSDQFHPICASLAKQWPWTDARDDRAPFVVARRPADRSKDKRSPRIPLGRGSSRRPESGPKPSLASAQDATKEDEDHQDGTPDL